MPRRALTIAATRVNLGGVQPRACALTGLLAIALLPSAAPAQGRPLDTPGPAAGRVDAMVAFRLADSGLEPAPRADRSTLLRRASLALTGLPPTLEELDAFLADSDPTAFERAVDRLLESPGYGEHQAVGWLDLARYADTNGYEKDRPRDAWPWRDWVIDAFQRDMPFDEFTVRQLAGDLLPDPTPEDLIATGFHRNAMLNDEGGVDAEEFRVVAVKDRVDATARTWLALTLDCAQCHDHPNDPITQREYYRFAAFFDSTEDDGVSLEPTVPWPLPEQREAFAALDREAATLRREYARDDASIRAAFSDWCAAQRDELAARDADPLRFESGWMELGPLVTGKAASAHSRRFGPERGVRLDRAVAGQRWHPAPVTADGALELGGEGAASYLFRAVEVGEPRDLTLNVQAADGPATDRPGTVPGLQVWWNGGPVLDQEVGAASGWPEPRALRLRPGRNELLVKVSHAAPRTLRVELADGPWPVDVRAGLARGDGATQAERRALDRWWRARADEFATTRAGLRALELRRESFALAGAPVLRELDEPRLTRVLERGDWTRPGEIVTPGTPVSLPAFPAELPANRLGLARWLVGPAAPRTARVVVNRIWAQHFGRGLIDTPDDFGKAGSAPSHPELLDFLAGWFVEHDWSVKALHRLIVRSATWQQDSRVTAEQAALDPHNRLLSRGPRFRIRYETIRDLGLQTAGLLHQQVGGPSVMPPQPPGIWEQSFGFHDLADRWQTAPAPARHRRGLYVYLRRTAPYPTFALFDGPRREICVAERSRTITPLQTLALWNDAAFLEAAGGLGRRLFALREDPARAVVIGHRLCTAREPTPGERDRLLELLDSARHEFAAEAGSGTTYCRSAGQLVPDMASSDQLAAWILVAQTLLTLHETLSQH